MKRLLNARWLLLGVGGSQVLFWWLRAWAIHLHANSVQIIDLFPTGRS